MSGLVPRPVSVVLAVVLMWLVMIAGLVAELGVSADIGGISGDGRVELGCFICSVVSSALLYLPASNRWFRVA
jgi:hypothetical protein